MLWEMDGGGIIYIGGLGGVVFSFDVADAEKI